MLAVRTGAVCVGTERTVDAIRTNGLTLVDGERTTVAHPEAVTRLDRPVSLLVVAVKAYALDAALDRIDPDAARQRRRAPAPQRPRARGRFDPLRASDTFACRLVAAGSIGRVEAYSPEPGFVVQRTPGALITAASRDLGRAALEAALAPLAVPGIDVVVADDERAVLWEKAARLAVLAAATVASGRTVGELRDDADWRERLRAALDEAVAVAVEGRGVAHGRRPMGDHRGDASRPDDLHGARRGGGPADGARRDHRRRDSSRRAAWHVDTPTLDALFEEARCRAPSR